MIKGIIFDVNGTLTNIYTTESDENLYRTMANFLDYYGIKISPSLLKEEYFSILMRQKNESKEEHAEFDVVSLFQEIIDKYKTTSTPEISAQTCAIAYRAAGRYKLELYDHVWNTLEKLKDTYQLAIVSDGQKIWAIPEIKSLNLDKFFDIFIISSEFGFRKPDQRMFNLALAAMNLKPSEVIYVGNDMYRDIYGGFNANMKTILYKSNQGEHNFCGAEADYIIYSFDQLPKAIEFIENKIQNNTTICN